MFLCIIDLSDFKEYQVFKQKFKSSNYTPVYVSIGMRLEVADRVLLFIDGPVPKLHRKLPKTPGTLVSEPPTKPPRKPDKQVGFVNWIIQIHAWEHGLLIFVGVSVIWMFLANLTKSLMVKQKREMCIINYFLNTQGDICLCFYSIINRK